MNTEKRRGTQLRSIERVYRKDTEQWLPLEDGGDLGIHHLHEVQPEGSPLGLLVLWIKKKKKCVFPNF